MWWCFVRWYGFVVDCDWDFFVGYVVEGWDFVDLFSVLVVVFE